jgi:hypothetical protein
MKRNSQFSAADVAAWMKEEFNRNNALFHDIAVSGIREKFGPEFTTLTFEGNYQFDNDVRNEFRLLTKDTAIWVPYRNYWRKCTPQDKPGRVQVKKQRATKRW